MAEAHRAGIVHRDLKPANLFLTRFADGSPCVKVLDFGVSKLTEPGVNLTHETAVLGSPLYMSPEQMEASKDVDARSDVWALGVVLYQLVANPTPFHGEGIQQVCTRVFFSEPTPLSTFRIGAPPGFEAVLLRCFEKHRGKLFGEGSWGTAIPVDSGDHTIEASAPGKKSWTGKVTVRAGAGTMTAEVPAFMDAVVEPAALPAPADPAPAGWSPQRTVGIAVGAAGLVGIVVGSVFGAKAMSADSDSHAHCVAPDFIRCDPQGQQLGKDAFSAATASTVGFLIGGAAVVGGVVTFLTAPSGAQKSASSAWRFEARPTVGAQSGGLLVSGRW